MSPADSQLLPDDSSSFTSSFLTASSSSTVLGPGHITGRFLKAVGGRSLDLVVSVVIRRRLAVIKQALEKTPETLRDPQSVDEWQQMNGTYTDLKELCREDYSLSIRRTAANLVKAITLMTRPVPDPVFIDASPTNGQWEALFTRIQRYEDLLSYLEDTVISTSRRDSNVSQRPPDPSGDSNPIQIGVDVKVEHSYALSDEARTRKTPIFGPRLFRSQRSEIPLPRSPDVPSPDIQKFPKHKVVVLGAGGVGKSTIVKQLRAIQHDTKDTESYYDTKDAESYNEIILNNLVESMKIIIHDLRDQEINTTNFSEFMDARTFVSSLYSAYEFIKSSDSRVPRLSHALRILWNHPQVRESARQIKTEGLLPDSAEYFLNSFDRIVTPNYVPTQEDIMRARIRTSGLHEYQIKGGQESDSFTWHLVDTGGERSERKKWIHCFENVTAVLFVVALPDYNKTLYEHESVNRMDESFVLFESIVNSKWFTNSLVILLFNKIDAFKEGLKLSPLKDWLPEYEGGTYDDACKYLEQRFSALVQNKQKPLPIHYISAVDATAMFNVFQMIKDEIGRHYEEQMSVI